MRKRAKRTGREASTQAARSLPGAFENKTVFNRQPAYNSLRRSDIAATPNPYLFIIIHQPGVRMACTPALFNKSSRHRKTA